MAGAPRAGLCEHCLHQRLVRNTRGSVFSLCERSRRQPESFARYPPLPVLECGGFDAVERRPPASGFDTIASEP